MSLFGTTFFTVLLYFITTGLSVANSSSPVEAAELPALSIASRLVDNDGNFVMDPSAIEIIETHARQQCGRLGKNFKLTE